MPDTGMAAQERWSTLDNTERIERLHTEIRALQSAVAEHWDYLRGHDVTARPLCLTCAGEGVTTCLDCAGTGKA